MLTGGKTGCEYWRVWAPVGALQRQGYPVTALPQTHPQGLDAAMQAQAVVLARLSWQAADYPAAVQWVQLLHRLGAAVLYETDDDLWSESFLVQGRIMERWKTEAQLDADRAARLAALRLCDGVTVPTPRLATVVRTLTDAPVQVVPNAIDWERWRTLCARGQRVADGPVIGWAGGKRADADLVPMAEAWGRIARRYPAVTFALVGYHSPAVQAAVPAAQLRLVPWVPLDLYPMAYHGWTIGCAPLADTPFNRCKSAIKAFEYAAADAAVVYSTPVYGRELRPNLDGLEANTADEWEAALARLLDEPDTRAQMAARWAKRVRERHSLSQNLWHWPAAWSTLVGQARRPRTVERVG
jgi:glycosyltransferase involved in cell wall biosynthesis